MAQRRAVPPLRAVPLLAALVRHGVRFVTVGSFSAILQGVDLPITDLDIVPAVDPENRRCLVAALDDLGARERIGDGEEPIDDLRSSPESIGDATFRTFVTEFGGIDVVLRPAGFPRGYEDLVDGVVVATVRDDVDPELHVDAVLANVRDVYESKRRAGRPKDIEALPAFVGIHPEDAKAALRARYRADVARREDGPDNP